MNKPITMRIAETKSRIIEVANESNLPIWLLNYIFNEICIDVSKLAQEEAEREQRAYVEEETNGD